MDGLFLMSNFRLYPGFKMSFEHNSVRKNLFLSACFCLDSRHSLREINQKFNFAGTIGYGDSYLEFSFRQFKKFGLHAKQHNAAGAVRAHSGKGLGLCYMIGRGPNSCLLGHVTGLLFCLYVFFLPSIFNSVDFRNSTSLIVLDIELTDKNMMVLYKDFHFVRHRLSNLINRQHGTLVIYLELRGAVESWIMRSCLLSFAA